MLRKKKQTPQEQSDQEFNLALEVPAEQRPKGWRPFVRRNWKRIAAAACAAAVAGAFLLPGKGAKPAGVDTEYLESAVERRNITNVFSGSGTIAAANTYTVNALVSGTVRSVSGADALSSGNLLVRTVTIAVNNTGSLTTAQAATASVNGVSALASAKFSYQNEQTITASTGGTVTALCVKEGASVSADTALVRISGKELTKQVQNASDNLRSAQMSMEDTEDQLNNYTITSPISGTVISKEVKAGDTVSNTAGSTSLCTIYDLSYLQMTVNVDELEILSIKEGQSVTITADAISDRTFTGVVTSVSKAGTTAGGTTTYPVTIRIDDTGDLLPGMNATAEITTASTENALSIPNAAVVRGNYVLVTKDSPSAANADPSMTAPEGYVYVKVTTGTSDDDYIAVISGLQEGDTVAYTASSTASVSADGQMEEMMVVGGPGQGGGGSSSPNGGGAPGGGSQ